MAKLIINNLLRDRLGELGGKQAGGVDVVDIDAADVRGLIKQLDQRFPGIAEKLKHNVAVAIDGEIFQHPMFEGLQEDSEVYFLPAIEGG